MPCSQHSRAGAGAGSSPQALWVQQEPELGLSAHLPGPRLELCMLGAVLQPGRGDSNPDCAPAICVTSGK